MAERDERIARVERALQRDHRVVAAVGEEDRHVGVRGVALGRYLEESEAYADWARAADLSRETSAWLLARPVEPLNAIHELPARPPDYALVATDGSQIDVERHGMAACYVINVGRVFLRYGARPAARRAYDAYDSTRRPFPHRDARPCV